VRGETVLVRRAFVLAILLATAAAAAEIHINGDQPVFVNAIPFTIGGTSTLPAGSEINVEIPNIVRTATKVAGDGTWQTTIYQLLATGTYDLNVSAGELRATQLIRVQLNDNLVRQSPFGASIQYAPPLPADDPSNFQEMTDRWRIAPPPYELDENPRARALGTRGATLDPYNKNLLKGDLPIFKNRQDWFLVLTGTSDTLAESRTLPTPSSPSANRPTSFRFFGDDNQNVFAENLIFSADLFQGNTAFKPVTQRIKATVIANGTRVHVEEDAILKPDVRLGTTRSTGKLSLQELFYERKLRDLTPNYDFVSIRAGSQPFTSDFRGFIFSDTNLGVRVFGNYASNRFQYNLAAFDRLEKDTNSGLNTMELRDQQVYIANLYWQDFFHKGFTETFSIHHVHDDATLKYDTNGILVRPAPVGVFQPHSIDATYLGTAGLGHFGRINVDHALYYVFGRDSLNPIAGPDPRLKNGNAVTISAGLAALEVSYDHDWWRPRLGFFYATGDNNPRDRRATGFDAIFESPNFAGGGFSFYNRLGIKLANTGVSLVERGSLFADLRSSKDEGQPNFVNPGVQLITAGVDIDVTPRLKAIVTANYIRLDSTKTVEQLLFQGDINQTLGEDLSLGLRYRPLLNQNIVIVGGAAAFIPGAGFNTIYESPGTLFHVFTNVILSF
jgi:hypothetical protein